MKTDPEIRIVPATENDLSSIAELASVIWRLCYPRILSAAQIDYMLHRMYSLQTLRDEILVQGIQFDQMFENAERVGFASYGPTEAPRQFKLHKLYLHPRCHGRGWGRLLLEHCMEAAASRGATRLILNVNKQNEAAIRTYARCGFCTVDSVVADIGGGFVMDDYVMAREIAG